MIKNQKQFKTKKWSQKRTTRLLSMGILLFVLTMVPLQTVSATNEASLEIQSQGILITGTIRDVNNQPIVGATIATENAQAGTITDFNGNFSLNIPEGTRLRVTYIGYVQQTIVAKKGHIDIVMQEDSQTLADVQVIAYGVQKKVTTTGAISSLGGQELTKIPTGSISNLFAGQLSGLTTVQYSGEPGSDAASIFIRGKATFGDSSPLVQVDGVERSMNDIDPNEVESITILKDASATAVFGVRGANGVVLITTKRGTEGKAKISVNSSFSLVQPTETIELANSYQYAQFYNQMLLNDNPNLTPEELKFSPTVIQKFKDKSDPIRFPDVDWVDYCLKNTTYQTQHNLNISGGTKDVRYFVSAGMYTQDGLFKQFDLPFDLTYQYNRFNYRSNLDLDVTKTTTLSMNIAGNLSNKWSPLTGQGSEGMLLNMYYSTPFSSPGFVDGKFVTTRTDYLDAQLPFTGGHGMSYYSTAGFYKNSYNKMSADLQLKQKLDFVTKGLAFHVKGSYNSAFSSTTTGTGGIDTYNPVLQSDGTMGYKINSGYKPVSYTHTNNSPSRNWYMEAALNYKQSFGDHNVSALALYNQSKTYYPSQYRDIPEGYVGLVGRITYDFKNKYLADFNVGYNGSENFAPSKRFGTFPSGSVGWVASEEEFFQPIKPYVSFLKLRVSVGLVGNDNIGSSRFYYLADPYTINSAGAVSRDGNGYLFGINNGTFSAGSLEASRNNPEVTWEKALKRNYGMDINFLDNRLKTTVEYYKETRKDIFLTDGTVPFMLGFDFPSQNLGEVKSWGWELTLKWDDKIGDKFRYYAGVNLMYNQNEITKRKEAPLNEEYQYSEGRRVGSRLQYQFFEYYNEQTTPAHYKEVFGQDFPEQKIGTMLKNGDCVYVDLNHDGIITDDDMTRDLGYTDDPEYMAGINMGFTWKRVELSMQWNAAWNVSRSISDVFRQPFKARDNKTTGGLLVYQVENTWTNENPDPNAKYPRATFDNGDANNYLGSTLWEKDAKYLRLRNLQVAYNFNFGLMKKLKVNTCQLALSGYNLLTFTPYIWGDPETRASNSPTYPLSKTYSVTLRVGF